MCIVFVSLVFPVRISRPFLILLNAQYFACLIVANGYPIRLRGAPLDLIHLAFGCRVGQYRIFDGARHLLNVPDQRLMIIAGRADVTRTETSALAFKYQNIYATKMSNNWRFALLGSKWNFCNDQ